jgi:hypothetical protein
MKKKAVVGKASSKKPGMLQKKSKLQQEFDDKKSAEVKKGSKRKAEEVEDDDDEDTEKKSKKVLNKRQQRRKEVTVLYSELINSGRDRKSEEVVSELLEILKERSTALPEYVGSLVGSRVVQACLKWGSRKQRQELLAALKDHLPKLAVDRCGHVVVQKLLTYATKTSKERKPTADEKNAQARNLREFLEPFQGKHVHTAFYHKHGCRVINSIYFHDVLSTKEKRRLLHAIAVPEAMALLRPELLSTYTLRQILTSEDVSSNDRQKIMSHLREAIEKAVDKELLGCDITFPLPGLLRTLHRRAAQGCCWQVHAWRTLFVVFEARGRSALTIVGRD